MNNIQSLALQSYLIWEMQQEADREIRRDRMVLVAANPEGSQRIFEQFKTSSEKKSMQVNPLDKMPEEQIHDTTDPVLAQVLEQIKSVGFGVLEE